MISNWFSKFASRFTYPSNFVTFDIETSGTDPINHLVCMIGHTVVRDDVPVENKEYFLDWTKHPGVDQLKLKQDLLNVENALGAKGKHFYHSYANLQKYGQDPVAVLNYYLTMFEDMENRKEVLVAHNGWRFDIEFMQASFHNWLNVSYAFDPELVYDSGAAEKASGLEDRFNPLPLTGETLQQWAYRIGSIRAKGVFWSLDGHCEEKYGLFKQAGISSRDAHRPAVDSYMNAILVKEHKKLAGVL